MKFFVKIPAHIVLEVDTEHYKHLGAEPTVEQILHEFNNPEEGADDPRVMAMVEGWGDFYVGEVTVCDGSDVTENPSGTPS